MLPSLRQSESVPRWRRSQLLRLRERTAQQHGHFFLNIDYDLCFAQPIGKPLVVAAQFLILTGQRTRFLLRPALLRRQTVEDSLGPLSPPLRQMRRVESFAP